MKWLNRKCKVCGNKLTPKDGCRFCFMMAKITMLEIELRFISNVRYSDLMLINKEKDKKPRMA